MTLLQLDLFLEISVHLILIAACPAEAFTMLACTCRSFYAWAQHYDQLWALAHNRQFGSLGERLDKVFRDGNMTWRSLVLARLRILRFPPLMIASWLAESYEANLGVNYSEAQLVLDAQMDGIYPCNGTLLAKAFRSLISFYTYQIQDRTGNSEDYFDSQIHKFKLSVHGNGPRTRGRYYLVERRGAAPVPFPKKATPTSVFTITIAALNSKSPQSRALSYFNGMLSQIHGGLVRLVCATFDASAAAFPNDPTMPKHRPPIKHVLLPPFGESQGPNLDISVPLSSVKWQELFPENSLWGGDQLLELIRTGNHRRRTCLLFFHPGGDPRLSPLAWVTITEMLNEYSTIAYGFPADDAYREGYDMSTFGANHLDYIIGLTLKSLRKYEAWRQSVGEDMYHSVGVERMVTEARLQEDDARRLHEVLHRMATVRGKGARVYEGKTRVVGDALPNQY